MAEAKQGRGKQAQRPLSPHLRIYSPQINMVMSIFHRLTGLALYFGSFLLAWWLVAAAAGPQYFAYVSGLLATWPGKVILFAYTWALMHHMIGGLRHFVWDAGYGYDLDTIDLLSWWTLSLSVTLTLGIWAFVIRQPGVL